MLTGLPCSFIPQIPPKPLISQELFDPVQENQRTNRTVEVALSVTVCPLGLAQVAKKLWEQLYNRGSQGSCSWLSRFLDYLFDSTDPKCRYLPMTQGFNFRPKSWIRSRKVQRPYPLFVPKLSDYGKGPAGQVLQKWMANSVAYIVRRYAKLQCGREAIHWRGGGSVISAKAYILAARIQCGIQSSNLAYCSRISDK